MRPHTDTSSRVVKIYSALGRCDRRPRSHVVHDHEHAFRARKPRQSRSFGPKRLGVKALERGHSRQTALFVLSRKNSQPSLVSRVGFRIIALDLRKIRFCSPRRIDAHSALALAKGLRRFSKRNESEESEKGRIANIPSQNGERKRTIQSRKSEKTVISRGPASGRRARVVIFVNIAYAYVRKAISCTTVTRTGTV